MAAGTGRIDKMGRGKGLEKGEEAEEEREEVPCGFRLLGEVEGGGENDMGTGVKGEEESVVRRRKDRHKPLLVG